MSRPMSAVLQLIHTRAKFCTSLLQSLDQCLQYGDITPEEHGCADRMMTKWLASAGYDLKCHSDYASRLLAFKTFIKRSVESERTSIR